MEGTDAEVTAQSTSQSTAQSGRRARFEANRRERIANRDALRARLKDHVRTLRETTRRRGAADAGPACQDATDAVVPRAAAPATRRQTSGHDEGSLFGSMLSNAPSVQPDPATTLSGIARSLAEPAAAQDDVGEHAASPPHDPIDAPHHDAQEPDEAAGSTGSDDVQDLAGALVGIAGGVAEQLVSVAVAIADVLHPVPADTQADDALPEPTASAEADAVDATAPTAADAGQAGDDAASLDAAGHEPDDAPAQDPPPVPPAMHDEPERLPPRTVKAAVRGSIDIVPILGPGMRIRLAQLGYSEADLADADPRKLKAELGPISRLLDVDGWIERARAQRAARPGG